MRILGLDPSLTKPRCVVSGGLYIIWLSDKHYYGGRSCNFSSRWRCHKRQLLNGNHPNPHAQAVFNREGRFEPRALELLPEEEHRAAEKHWLDENVGRPGCVNISRSSEGIHKGFNHSEETKAKFRARRPSEDTRRKLREARKNHIFTEATKRKISEGLTGQKRPWTAEFNRLRTGWEHTDDAKRKIAEGAKHPCPESTKAKISKTHKSKGTKAPGFAGRSHSEETKRKMSESSKGPRTMTPEERQRRSEAARLFWAKRKEQQKRL